jgi:hypothetical protein
VSKIYRFYSGWISIFLGSGLIVKFVIPFVQNKFAGVGISLSYVSSFLLGAFFYRAPDSLGFVHVNCAINDLFTSITHTHHLDIEVSGI